MFGVTANSIPGSSSKAVAISSSRRRLPGFLLLVCERTTVMRFVVMIVSVIHLPLDLTLRLIPRPFETLDVVLGGQQERVFRIEVEEPACAIVVDIDRCRVFHQLTVETKQRPVERRVKRRNRFRTFDLSDLLLRRNYVARLYGPVQEIDVLQ